VLEYLEDELFARALRECSGSRIKQSDARIDRSDERTDRSGGGIERSDERMEGLDESCMKQYIQVRPSSVHLAIECPLSVRP